jgi:hypothetical protein
LAANDYWNKNKKNLHINRETDKLIDVQNMHKVDKILYRQTNKKHITILGFSFWFIETRKEREMSKGKTKQNEIKIAAAIMRIDQLVANPTFESNWPTDRPTNRPLLTLL